MQFSRTARPATLILLGGAALALSGCGSMLPPPRLSASQSTQVASVGRLGSVAVDPAPGRTCDRAFLRMLERTDLFTRVAPLRTRPSRPNTWPLSRSGAPTAAAGSSPSSPSSPWGWCRCSRPPSSRPRVLPPRHPLGRDDPRPLRDPREDRRRLDSGDYYGPPRLDAGGPRAVAPLREAARLRHRLPPAGGRARRLSDLGPG